MYFFPGIYMHIHVSLSRGFFPRASPFPDSLPEVSGVEHGSGLGRLRPLGPLGPWIRGATVGKASIFPFKYLIPSECPWRLVQPC